MDADRLLTAFIGAFFGATGWLVVGFFTSASSSHVWPAIRLAPLAEPPPQPPETKVRRG
ncbi:hypothetical protein BH20CHL5_BH20CHL5_10330 [soil metagenome]